MLCWVDPDSGTWGASAPIFVTLIDEEADVFGELSDTDRVKVAQVMVENNDDPYFDLYSALAALGI